MSGNDRIWFAETTADEVRSLLADVDYIGDCVFIETLLTWVRGDTQWFAGNREAVRIAHGEASRRRKAPPCDDTYNN